MSNIKKHACYTPDQQAYYEGLNERQRKYVDYRSTGLGKTQAYEASGYRANHPGQAAYVLEKDNPVIADLIETRLMVVKAKELFEEDSKLTNELKARALQSTSKHIVDSIQEANPDTVERIKFYRDIIHGREKSEKVTEFIDADGRRAVKVEKSTTIADKIKARKELDVLLGLNKIIDFSQDEVDEITINFVDAGKNDGIIEHNPEKIEKEVEDLEHDIIDGEIIREDLNEVAKWSNQKHGIRKLDNMG